MANHQYYLRFGSDQPSTHSGLSPTFISFRNASGGATTAPSISEVSTTGIYTFSYEAQGSINFVVDGATTGLSSSNRYIAGSVDLTDRLNDFIGLTTDAIGDSSTSPTTLYGYLKRIRNWLEGQSTYTRATGGLVTKDITGATTLSSRTITDNTTTVDRT